MNINNLLDGIIEVPKMFRNNSALKNITMIEGFIDLDEYKKRSFNYKGAKKYAYNLRKGGYTDWRLPTFYELNNIYRNIKLLSDNSIGFLPYPISLWTIDYSGDWIRTFEIDMLGYIKGEFHNNRTIRTVMCVR